MVVNFNFIQLLDGSAPLQFLHIDNSSVFWQGWTHGSPQVTCQALSLRLCRGASASCPRGLRSLWSLTDPCNCKLHLQIKLCQSEKPNRADLLDLLESALDWLCLRMINWDFSVRWAASPFLHQAAELHIWLPWGHSTGAYCWQSRQPGRTVVHGAPLGWWRVLAWPVETNQ